MSRTPSTAYVEKLRVAHELSTVELSDAFKAIGTSNPEMTFQEVLSSWVDNNRLRSVTGQTKKDPYKDAIHKLFPNIENGGPVKQIRFNKKRKKYSVTVQIPNTDKTQIFWAGFNEAGDQMSYGTGNLPLGTVEVAISTAQPSSSQTPDPVSVPEASNEVSEPEVATVDDDPFADM
jgi:hypothetical protein